MHLQNVIRRAGFEIHQILSRKRRKSETQWHLVIEGFQTEGDVLGVMLLSVWKRRCLKIAPAAVAHTGMICVCLRPRVCVCYVCDCMRPYLMKRVFVCMTNVSCSGNITHTIH